MQLPDVNVLINAMNEGAEQHERAAAWLSSAARGTEAIALPGQVLSAVVRITTGANLGAVRRTPQEAISFCDAIREMPTATRIVEGPRHWALFCAVVMDSGISGRDITDAYLAAFALETGATFVTFDQGFRRFPGVKVNLLF